MSRYFIQKEIQMNNEHTKKLNLTSILKAN